MAECVRKYFTAFTQRYFDTIKKIWTQNSETTLVDKHEDDGILTEQNQEIQMI